MTKKYEEEEDYAETLTDSIRERVLWFLELRMDLVDCEGYLHRTLASGRDVYSPLGVLCKFYQEVIGDLFVVPQADGRETIWRYHSKDPEGKMISGADAFPPKEVLDVFDMSESDALWLDKLGKTGIMTYHDIGVLLVGTIGWEE